MKHLIVVFICLTVFTNCQSHKSPKETVIAYLAATNRFDSKTAKEFLILNDKNLQTLETLQKMEKSMPDERKSTFLNKEKEAVYYEKKITDSSAQIIVTPKQDIVLPIEFNLKKVDDNWFIESIIHLQ